MKTLRFVSPSVRSVLALTTMLATTVLSNAQMTNWVAYNDHRGGLLNPPHVPSPTNWGTALRVTTLDMGAPANSSGTLTNFLTGDPLAATLTVTLTGAPDDFGTVTVTGIPGTNTPAGKLFYGVCDLSNSGIVGVRVSSGTMVTLRFDNLNPAKHYVFRGTGARGGGYAPRWTVATITADGWVDAHLNGTGPGVITSNNFPASLGAGQAAWNSGHNAQGAVVGWDFIAPAPDGSFSILCAQYVGPYNGGAATADNYGYSFGAILLAEVEVAPPVIATNPPALTTVEQNRPINLRVAATGTPLLYQWYKQGAGAIPGATFPTYSISQAALTNSGNYYAVVYNPLASTTSTVAQVTVFADTNAPSVGSIFSYPTVDSSGVATLDQIIIEFNEPVQPASVSSPTRYTVPGGGNPASVIVTNDRSVVLILASPLAEDTAYSVTVSGMMDAVGNTAGSSSAPFRSWKSGLGNGLLFEAFNAGPGVEVDTLTSSANYPNNAFLRATLRTFDSRVVFPDDTHEQYGSRIRGVFIPPVSGDWVFFFRTRDRGVVYLNPNGTDAAGKIEILRESTGNTPLNWDKFTSPPFSLQAGRGYYIESLHKADTGADFIKVAARLLGTGFPLPVNSLDTDVDTNSITGASIGAPLAPRDLGGTLTIAQDVGDLTVESYHFATFSVAVNNPSGLPLFYQWYKGASPINGANGPTYTFQATNADSGATFSVQVGKAGSTVTSRTATLTVVPDITGPEVFEVISSDTNLANVVVRFNELVYVLEAQETFNYSILDAGPVVNLATLQADGRTVTLMLDSPLVLSNTYRLQVLFVTDVTGNVINPNPTVVTFTAGVVQPRLSIARSGNQVTIQWSTEAAGYTLQQADAIVTPANEIAWTTVGTAPIVSNGNNSVSLTLGPGLRIFRLQK